MKRNPHPDLVRAHLKRWRTRLLRALSEVAKLEHALVRAEKKRRTLVEEAKQARLTVRLSKQHYATATRHIPPPAREELQ